MKNYFFCIILACSFFKLSAQGDYRPGYIITNSKDTIHGFVNNQVGLKNYRQCQFKKSKAGYSTDYAPSDIYGYRFSEGKYFISKEMPTKEGSKKVFVEMIIDGRLSLFRYNNAYYAEKEGEATVYILENTETEVIVNEEKAFKENKEYVGILNMLMSDCRDQNLKIQSVRLKERSLTKLFEDYNECQGVAYENYKGDENWYIKNVGFNIGYVNSRLRKDTFLERNFDRISTVTVGGNYEIIAPKVNDKLSLLTGLHFLSGKYVDGSSTYGDEIVEHFQVRLPLSIKYALTKNKTTPYFNLGIIYTLNLSSNYEVPYNTVNNIYSDHHFGYMLGGGIQRKIDSDKYFYVDFRLEKLSPNINPKIMKISTHFRNLQLSFGMNFRINKE